MFKKLLIIACLLFKILGVTAQQATSHTRIKNDMIIWYRQPADKWLEALPIGNGYMGGMVFGGISQERIALNESSFWSGRPHDYNDLDAYKYYPKIRQLVVDEQFQEAEKMADAHFWGIPAAQQAYEPVGNLLLFFDGIENAQDYRRELNMETGIVTIKYRVGDVNYTREVFMSYPDHVMVIRLYADKPNSISVKARLNGPYADKLSAVGNTLTMDGTWKPGSKKDWLIADVKGNGIAFRSVLNARTEGGIIDARDSVLSINKANAVTLVLTIATSYINYKNINGNPVTKCAAIMDAVEHENYTQLRLKHVKDFSGLMGRVHLLAGDTLLNKKPTDERLAAVRLRPDADYQAFAHIDTAQNKKNTDPNLEALTFQFGRYILVSSSRKGGQPANLQGIWNENVIPNWGSKYTININTEMNYWPTEVCNLSECHQPLFDLIKDISVTGTETAKDYYQHGGWVTHHNTDLWRGSAPVDAARFGMWPMGGAWLCQDLWEHYAFTGDKQFLTEYYPVMRGAAQFLLELMVVDPKHGWLVTPFSMSPEHGYYDSHGNLSYLSPSPTMDIAIIRELFPHCIEAAKILGIDTEFSEKLQLALSKMPPYQISRSGFLQEWIEDWKPAPAGHNVSPNFTIYPGSSIRLHRDTQFAAAIERWMYAHPARGGFPAAWDIAVWSRLENSSEVAATSRKFIGNTIAPNLHNRGTNQSDATFGYTAAIAESLLQSQDDEVTLLPALSNDWKDGAVEGLRARGGYEVSMNWKDGVLSSASLHSLYGQTLRVRYKDKKVTLDLKPGETIWLNADLTINHKG
ncbi:glycoside hydrolase family 95 protein [Mucilaginibacter sp.]